MNVEYYPHNSYDFCFCYHEKNTGIEITGNMYSDDLGSIKPQLHDIVSLCLHHYPSS